jgi:hypothetical protein
MASDSMGWQAKFTNMRALMGPPKRVKEAMYNFDNEEYERALGWGRQ